MMPISFQVLGLPGRDNALWVRVETGQSVTRLLFDCGDGCLSDLTFGEIQTADHLFFSHLHMDHIGGFDSFFRCNFNRGGKPNHIWGPTGTAKILQHRFQGFWWNLIGEQEAAWWVHDVGASRVDHHRFELAEAFEQDHAEGGQDLDGPFLEGDGFTVEALPLKHHGLCLGYVVRETPKRNVSKERMAELGLRPGPWLAGLKDEQDGAVDVNGKSFQWADLRRELLVETPGQSLAYVTDFLLDEPTFRDLTSKLEGCDTVVCEAQYRHQDLALAEKNHHTTVRQVTEWASEAEIQRLLLFHLSERYGTEERKALLDEAREIYPATEFSPHWSLDEG